MTPNDGQPVLAGTPLDDGGMARAPPINSHDSDGYTWLSPPALYRDLYAAASTRIRSLGGEVLWGGVGDYEKAPVRGGKSVSRLET